MFNIPYIRYVLNKNLDKKRDFQLDFKKRLARRIISYDSFCIRISIDHIPFFICRYYNILKVMRLRRFSSFSFEILHLLSFLELRLRKSITSNLTVSKFNAPWL